MKAKLNQMAATRIFARIVPVLILITVMHPSNAQPDSTTVNRKKVLILAATTGVVYTGSMAVLAHAWYSEFDKEPFHWFNDFHEWKQVDKAGHFYSAYYLSDYGSWALQACNVPPRKSDIIASVAGIVMISSIEIFDGFSAAYGASASDLAFNVAGSLFYLGQRALWKQPRLLPKFSYHHTEFSTKRPEVLGEGASALIKDYNGQTYWLSADMDKFMRFPRWLNLAAGYGADNMLYGNDAQNTAAGYSAYRQFYLAIDLDLTAIPTRSKFLRGLLRVASAVRLPAPAIEFSRDKVAFHPFYF
jgi:uncharacterized protein YfiM (DUF2279 family)